ncbi:class I SAM-dependent RNA methyltransferase [Candidatus Saccharibacteria bacterium]|nr:class I SAM-dependent RNA methyltransferase [Candidatus Saccharibacteria bacterium]
MIKIDKIIPGGQALGTEDSGKKVFFWNALPGELVTDYKITKTKSSFLEAIALNVENPSKHRVASKDECFLSTSPWQIMDYNYELELKQELVVEIFREHQINIDTPEIITDNKDYYYRNKMEYALYWDNEQQKIRLAFHGRGSHQKIPITKSSIERPEIFQAATTIIDDLNSRHEEARKYQSLLLRCNQEGIVSGGLFENKKPHPHFNNLNDSILGHNYSYSPNGFFQINLPVYEMALSEIKKHINTDEVLDLYAGVGTIGLSVARDKHLTLVECDKYAFNEMAKNITIEGPQDITKTTLFPTICDNGSKLASEPRNDGSERSGLEKGLLSNITAILAKSENVLQHIKPSQTVILDPPRSGCDKKLISKLLEITPQKIIYLSCNPATQARDTKLLLEKYHIDKIKTFNFFPHTPHIENLIVLSL